MNTPRARWWSHAWDRLSIYLPVLLMGGLALASYWLIRLTPTPEPPAPPRPVSHEPDYFMRDFALRNFNAAGLLEHELKGQELRHYPDTGELEVDGARLLSLHPSGRVSTAQADRLTANANQTEYRLTGNVVLVREGDRVTAETLDYDTNRSVATLQGRVQARLAGQR